MAGQAIETAQKRRFDVDDAIAVLLGLRKEAFRGERGTRLFQLQTWIMFPSETNAAPDHAGRIAAAAILQTIEEESFPEDEIVAGLLAGLLQDSAYKAVYDTLLAHGGGWSRTLLDCVGPTEFDSRIKARAKHIERVVKLFDVRLRLVQNHPQLRQKARISGAIGVTIKSGGASAKSSRTNWGSWSLLSRTSLFNYIIERHKFDMRPRPVSDSEEFAQFVLHPPITVPDLKTFFGMCVFAAQLLGENELLPSWLFDAVPPVAFQTEPLSAEQLEAARDHTYDDLL